MNNQLPTDYQSYLHISRYARWNEEEQRRESWHETVDRYFSFFAHEFLENQEALSEISQIKDEMLSLGVLPSMRCLMTAGKALERDNVAGYNCAYVPVDSPRTFDETLYILMCGTGIGFSVERQYVNKLPCVAEELHSTDTVISVRDSKIGWATGLKELVAMLYAGQIPTWDLSKLRPKGARLKTMGGRSSGPEPLEDLFNFVVKTFRNAAGRKLNSLECHDIMCKIGDVVVVGGVRRSALISLSNLTDRRMRDAKSGSWWEQNPQRALANNSVCYTETPDVGAFMEEFLALYNSKSGERGLFNREAAAKQAAKSGRREVEGWDFGTNPCSEIVLRPRQFCNLTEVVARPTDSLDDLKRKVRYATIMGTWQSSLTNFRYISKKWKDNCEEERLLGVSITGIMDHASLNGAYTGQAVNWFDQLKEVAIETNKEYAAKLGINASVAITCVKPSGTASQLANSASGIHSRYAPYYVRRVRQDNKDPLTQMMIDAGVPAEPCVMKPDHTTVFSFPIKAPEEAVTRNDRTAIEELDHWKLVQDYWCEHKPSVTINVREHEWPAVAAWCWENFDYMSGVSFLPHDSGTYQQAPYEEITRERYEELEAAMPVSIDWSKLSEYETEDHTTASKELACTGGVCEI